MLNIVIIVLIIAAYYRKELWAMLPDREIFYVVCNNCSHIEDSQKMSTILNQYGADFSVCRKCMEKKDEITITYRRIK